MYSQASPKLGLQGPFPTGKPVKLARAGQKLTRQRLGCLIAGPATATSLFCKQRQASDICSEQLCCPLITPTHPCVPARGPAHLPLGLFQLAIPAHTCQSQASHYLLPVVSACFLPHCVCLFRPPPPTPPHVMPPAYPPRCSGLRPSWKHLGRPFRIVRGWGGEGWGPWEWGVKGWGW